MQQDYTLLVCAKTEIGLKRKCNEDSYFTCENGAATSAAEKKGFMFAVADGMGGHPGGDIASQMAVRGLTDYYRLNGNKGPQKDSEVFLKHLEKTVFSIHRRIENYGQTHPEMEGLGTTLSVLVIAGGKALMAHVGDSRIYRLRNRRLEQMTCDHTLVGHFIEAGVMTAEEASEHPLRHMMMQAVGHGIEQVFTRQEDLQPQDLFLLCSDGLHGLVPEEEIRKTLLSGIEHRHLCRQLVEKALQHGGNDNVTVVAVRAEK